MSRSFVCVRARYVTLRMIRILCASGLIFYYFFIAYDSKAVEPVFRRRLPPLMKLVDNNYSGKTHSIRLTYRLKLGFFR
jgi:hypothetical protein